MISKEQILKNNKKFANFKDVVNLLREPILYNFQIVSTKEMEQLMKQYPCNAGVEHKKYFFNSVKLYCYSNSQSEDSMKRIIIAGITCFENNFNLIYSILADLARKPSLEGFCDLITTEKFYQYLLEGLDNLLNFNINDQLFHDINIKNDLENIIKNNLTMKEKIHGICHYFKDDALKHSKLIKISKTGGYSVYNKTVNETGSHTTIGNIGNIIDDYIVYGQPLGYWANHLQELSIMNPVTKTIYMNYLKYSKWVEELDKNSLECRQIKSILYVLSYFAKNGHSDAGRQMNQLTNVSTNWAVGTEKTDRASFYGKSKIAKAMSGYYPFMVGEENPYKELINNLEHQKLDHHALNLRNEFAKKGLSALGINTHLFDGIKILENIKDIIKVLDEVITVEIGLSNWIKSFLTGIINAIANMLDISITESFKQLFYIRIIPFGEKKVSLSDIYNHLEMIKFILKTAEDGKYNDVKNLTKEMLLEDISKSLGIDHNTFKEIGYGAYDKELNVKAGMIAFSANLAKGKSRDIFTVKSDLPLLYMLIEFALQKEAFVYGNNQAKVNMIYGDFQMLNYMISRLTVTEVYYVIHLFPDVLESFRHPKNIDYILKQNQKIDLENHIGMFLDTALYEQYMKENLYYLKNRVDEDINFKRYYTDVINTMLNYTKKIMLENKESLYKDLEEANNLTDIDDFLMRFLPSMTEFMKLLGKNEFSTKEVIKLIETIQKFISNDLFVEVILVIRQKIMDILERAEQEAFKKIDDAVGDLNASVTMDLNIGMSHFVQTIENIVDIVNKYGINIPDFVFPCFQEGVDYIDNNFTNYEDGMTYQGGSTGGYRNDWDLKNETTKNKINGKKQLENNDYTINPNAFENIVSTPEKKDVISSSKREKLKKIIDGKKVYVNKDGVEHPENNIKDNIHSDGYYKIIYKKGDIIAVKNNGEKITLIKKDQLLKNGKNKRNNTNDIIEKILSEDNYKKIEEIRNFIENISNLEYHHLQKQLTIAKRELEKELSKPRSNKATIDKIDENIMNLTKKIHNAKNNNILNSKTGFDKPIEITTFKVQNKKIVPTDDKKYKTLNDFFSTKSALLEEINKGMSNPDVDELYVTSYQITELLK